MILAKLVHMMKLVIKKHVISISVGAVFIYVIEKCIVKGHTNGTKGDI